MGDTDRRPVKAKTTFLKSLKNNDAKMFLGFSEQHKSKRSVFTFEDLLSSLSEEELIESWHGILELVQLHTATALEVNCCPSAAEKQMSTSVLHAAAQLGIITFDHLSKVPMDMLQMTVFLHDILLNFSGSQDTLQNIISMLCEKFWINNVDGKEELISNSIIYLLRRTLGFKVRKCDVKRVWLMKDCIKTLFEKEDFAEKEELRHCLKQCVTSPLYLSTHEGTKFIEFILCLDESTVEIYHNRIKLRFPQRSLKQCYAYGTIYYNAWMRAMKNNVLPLKEKLELNCIQDFMYHAVHVQRNRQHSLVPLLRKFLAPFHEKKKEYRVLRMLRTLYEPIIWRGLKNANGGVRANAAQIFFDVFPLEDPDMNIADTDTELQRQLLLVKDLMLDEYPVVRCIAAIGVCLIMSYNWELLSSDIVKTYFKILIEDLARDSSCADVRCAVAKGLKTLLTENQAAVPTLKVFLPLFRDLFHDISEKVRVTFCHVLLTVKKIRFIKYWEIVPSEHLLARLEEDKPSVAKLIVELIYNSYLPESKTEDVWLSRCMQLIKSDPVASKVFFQHLPQFASLEAVVKLMIIACRTLNLYVNAKTKRVKPLSQKAIPDNKENAKDGVNDELMRSFREDGPIGFDNPLTVAGLVDAVAIMWLGVQNDLEKPENKMLKKELVARSASHVSSLLKYFKDSNIWPSVFFLCAFIPQSFLPDLSDICLSRLLNLPEECSLKDYETLLVCLCSHNKTGEVLQAIREWIHHDLIKEQKTFSKRRTKRKKLSHADGVPAKPLLAVKFLELMTDHALCRSSLLKSDVETVQGIVKELSFIQKKITEVKSSLDSEDQKMFLLNSFSTITKIAVLLETEKDSPSDLFFRRLLTWAAEEIIQTQQSSPPNASSRRSRQSVVSAATVAQTKEWKELALMICKDLLRTSSDMILMGFGRKTCSEYIEFAKRAIETDFGPRLILQCIGLVYNLSEDNRFLVDDDSLEDRVHNQSLIKDAFLLLVNKLSEKKFYEEIPEKSEVRTRLKELLLSQMKSHHATSADKENLFSSIMACSVNPLVPIIEKLQPDVSMTELPPSVLLHIMNGNEELIRNFINFALTWVKGESLASSVAAFCVLTQIVHDNKSLLKKLQVVINRVCNDFHTRFKLLQSKDTSDHERIILEHGLTKTNCLKSLIQSVTATEADSNVI